MPEWKSKTKRGQVQLIPIGIAALTMLGGIVTAKITANATINEKIAEVKTETAVLSKVVNLNETNTTGRLNRLEDKIDWLVRQQGGVPSQIINKPTANYNE